MATADIARHNRVCLDSVHLDRNFHSSVIKIQENDTPDRQSTAGICFQIQHSIFLAPTGSYGYQTTTPDGVLCDVGLHMGAEIFDLVQHHPSDVDFLRKETPRDIVVVGLPDTIDIPSLLSPSRSRLLGVWRGCHGLSEDRNILGTEILVIKDHLVSHQFPAEDLCWMFDFIWHAFDAKGVPIARNSTRTQKEGTRRKELVVKFYLVHGVRRQEKLIQNYFEAMGPYHQFGERGFRMEYFRDYTTMLTQPAHSAWVDVPHATHIGGVREFLFADELLDILLTDDYNWNVFSNSGCVVMANAIQLAHKGGDLPARLIVFWDKNTEEATNAEALDTIAREGTDYWVLNDLPLTRDYAEAADKGLNLRILDARLDFLFLGERYRINQQSSRTPGKLLNYSGPNTPPTSNKRMRKGGTPQSMTKYTPQASDSSSGSSMSAVSIRTAADQRFTELFQRMQVMEQENKVQRAEQEKLQSKIDSMECRMEQMSSHIVDGTLTKLNEVADRVLEDRDKYRTLQARILRSSDPDKKFDLEEKLKDLDKKMMREMQQLHQLRSDVTTKAQDQNLQLSDTQLRTDV